MWNFDGQIDIECSTCNALFTIPVSDFDIDLYDIEYKENGMGQKNHYDLQFEFNCSNCKSLIKIDFDATEYPLGALSYIIDNSEGAICTNEPYITYLEEELIYTLPEPQIIVPDNKIITDLNLIRANIPDLIKFLSENPNYLYQIEPRDFEEIIAEIFRKKGFEVTLTKRTRDGGKDIIAIHRNVLGIDTKYFIECKRYAQTNKVGVDIVRALQGVKNTADGPNKVIIATTSTFTKGAQLFVNNEIPSSWDISLKDYNDIVGWLKNY